LYVLQSKYAEQNILSSNKLLILHTTNTNTTNMFATLMTMMTTLNSLTVFTEY